MTRRTTGPVLHNRGARQDIDERVVDVNVNVEDEG